jgi:hypothetical protein
VTEEPTKDSIEHEFPGWEVWRRLDNRWHARIKGATPPVMAADDHLDGLREEIVRKVSQLEAADHLRPGHRERAEGYD